MPLAAAQHPQQPKASAVHGSASGTSPCIDPHAHRPSAAKDPVGGAAAALTAVGPASARRRRAAVDEFPRERRVHVAAGPQALPESWLEGGALPPDISSPPTDRRELQYTGGKGDYFRPRLHFFNAHLERTLNSALEISLSGFARFSDG